MKSFKVVFRKPFMNRFVFLTLLLASPILYAFDTGAACGGDCSNSNGGWLGAIVGLFFFGYFIYLAVSVFWNSVLLGKVAVREGDGDGHTNTEIANRILNYPQELTPDSWITKEEKALIEAEKESSRQ